MDGIETNGIRSWIQDPGYEMRANSPIGKLHRRIREVFLERVSDLPADQWAYQAGRDGNITWEFLAFLIDKKYRMRSLYTPGSDWYQIRIWVWPNYPLLPEKQQVFSFFYRDEWKDGGLTSFQAVEEATVFPAITAEEIVRRLLLPMRQQHELHE